jgi:citrate lyase subunit beta/citryl-CoA lyase
LVPDDVVDAADAGHHTVMLPKATAADDLDALDNSRVLAVCETAAGVLHTPQIAEHPACAASMWGGEDLIADLGGWRSRDARGRYYPVVEHARLTALLAAAAACKAAVDSVHSDIADLDGLTREITEAVDLGFAAKTCIHPSDVPVIRDAFRATEEMLV